MPATATLPSFFSTIEMLRCFFCHLGKQKLASTYERRRRTPAKWWACSIPTDRTGFLNNTLSLLTDTCADRLYYLRITCEEVYLTIIQMDSIKFKCYCLAFERLSLGIYHSFDDFFIYITCQTVKCISTCSQTDTQYTQEGDVIACRDDDSFIFVFNRHPPGSAGQNFHSFNQLSLQKYRWTMLSCNQTHAIFNGRSHSNHLCTAKRLV